MFCQCVRCGHEWNNRTKDQKPLACPSCKSYVWEKPKEQKTKEVKKFGVFR